MNTTKKRWLAGVLAGAMVSLAQAAGTPTADTEPSELPEGVVAKMDRLSSKQININDRRGRQANSGADGLAHGSSAGASTPACGSLNVGNVTSSPFGGGPRQVNVLIKGDVINANNKCGR